MSSFESRSRLLATSAKGSPQAWAQTPVPKLWFHWSLKGAVQVGPHETGLAVIATLWPVERTAVTPVAVTVKRTFGSCWTWAPSDPVAADAGSSPTRRTVHD